MKAVRLPFFSRLSVLKLPLCTAALIFSMPALLFLMLEPFPVKVGIGPLHLSAVWLGELCLVLAAFLAAGYVMAKDNHKKLMEAERR